MNDRELLPVGGKFYKANLHSHTTLSDGHLTTEEAKALYKKNGYSILAYTDHRHYGWHPELLEKDFIPLAAFEADLNEFFKKPGGFKFAKTYHLNFYDTNPFIRQSFTAPQPPQRYGDIHSLNAFIEEQNEQGFLCCYNHPWWSLQQKEDYIGLRGLFAMEIYNHGCEQDGLFGYAPQAYDDLLREGVRLNCLSTDDNHNSYGVGDVRSDSLGGFNMLKMEALSYENTIGALRRGEFYSSTGPLINSLYIKNNTLIVECEPVEKIYMITASRNCPHIVSNDGDTLTGAEFPLAGDEGYIRVDCEDTRRRHAYSNAYFMDVL